MHSVQVTTTRPKRRDYKCKCVTQSSKAVWIDKGWTYHGRVLLGSFRVLMYNGRALLRPLRVLIYSGRVPSGPHLQWSGPFGSSSGPFGSSFRLVGSYTPFGLYKDTTMGAGCGRQVGRVWHCSPNSSSNGVSTWATKARIFQIHIMRKLVLRLEVVQPPTLDRIILPGNEPEVSTLSVPTLLA